jgi:hypothetical protein
MACSGCSDREGSQPATSNESTLSSAPVFTSAALSHYNDLCEALATVLQADQEPLDVSGTGIHNLLSAPHLATQIHTNVQGDALVTAARLTDEGLGTRVRLLGAIATVPSALTLEHKLDLQAKTVSATVTLEQPTPFEHTWNFAFGGVVDLPSGGFTASSLHLDPKASPSTSGVGVGAPGPWHIDPACVTRCGGKSVSGVLITCLWSLIAGPEAYSACVLDRAGVAALGIAWCTVRHCVHSGN